MNTEWFAIQEFWNMLNYEVGKKFVRTAKSKLIRKACKEERGYYIRCFPEEVVYAKQH